VVEPVSPVVELVSSVVELASLVVEPVPDDPPSISPIREPQPAMVESRSICRASECIDLL
jgi:hypothetical protein